MSSASSQTLSHSSTSTMDHQWDPRQVLKLTGDGRCVGLIETKERKCLNRIHRRNIGVFDEILIDISSQPLDAALLRPMLKHLAQNGLCKQIHRHNQVGDMVRQWTIKINDAARSAELAAATPGSGADTRSTTTLFTSPQPLQTSATNELRRPLSAIISEVLPAPAQSEEESIRSSTEAMNGQNRTVEPRLERPHTPEMPQINLESLVTRVPTAEISPLRLSRTLSATSSTGPSQTVHSRYSTASSRSPSPAQSVFSQSPSFSFYSSSSSSSPPSSPSVTPMRRAQPVLRTNGTTTGNPPTSTPSSQMPTASYCTTTHVRRLPFSDECPICYSDEPLSVHPASELVWCTSSCGRTVHKSCFDKWTTRCQEKDRRLSCPICRADWTRSCGCGGLSSCDIVHVTKRDTEEPCCICKEDMRDGRHEELEWCKDGCGQSVHKDCADTWAAQCIEYGKKPTCTRCRAEWRLGCNC